MKNHSVHSVALFIAFSVQMFTFSCTTEEISEIKNLQETEKDTVSQKSSCNSCNEKPGDHANFSAVLRDSKIQSAFLDKEIKEAENYCNTKFFYLCNDRLVMVGDKGKSDRTELRQEKDLSLNSYSSMVFNGIIEDVPTSSSTKGVTIAQIHNDYKDVSRPLIRVDIVGGNKILSHINNSYIKNDGPASNDNMGSFSNGDRIYLRLQINDSGDKVKVYVENKTKGTVHRKTYTVNSKWDKADGQYYYKVGVYAQVEGKNTKASYKFIRYEY